MRKFTSTLVFGSLLACGTSNSSVGTSAQTRDVPSAEAAPAQQAASEFRDATPDAKALTLDADATSAYRVARQAVETPLIAGAVKTSVTELNDALKNVLAKIDELQATVTPEEPSADLRVWTLSQNGLTYRFKNKKLSEKKFAWLLDVRKDQQNDDAYVHVLSGHIVRRPDAGARKGAGAIGVDLSAYRLVAEGTAAAITRDGKIFGAFAHSPRGSHLVYRVKDYKADVAGSDEAVTAYFSGYRIDKNEDAPIMALARAGGHFNADGFADLNGAANERVNARLIRVAGAAGWGRAIISRGDLPKKTTRHVRECWSSDQDGTESLYLRAVWDCTPSILELPNCVRKPEFSFPNDADMSADPDSADLKRQMQSACFNAVGDSLKVALDSLLESEAPLSEDPSEADTYDKKPTIKIGSNAGIDAVSDDDSASVDTSVGLTIEIL